MHRPVAEAEREYAQRQVLRVEAVEAAVPVLHKHPEPRLQAPPR